MLLPNWSSGSVMISPSPAIYAAIHPSKTHERKGTLEKIKDRQDQANMIETLSNGHTVEITVKINYVSDSPEDLIKN